MQGACSPSPNSINVLAVARGILFAYMPTQSIAVLVTLLPDTGLPKNKNRLLFLLEVLSSHSLFKFCPKNQNTKFRKTHSAIINVAQAHPSHPPVHALA